MKTNLKDPELFKLIKSFLTSYLPVIKKKSTHTISAYRDALNLFFLYLTEKHTLAHKDICMDDFNQKKIVDFLEWLKTGRDNKAPTINQRLSHIRRFCKYLMKNEVLSFVAYQEICDISEFKDTRTKDFVWLCIEDVKLILQQPDLNKKTGIRDRFFLALLYESGCRDDEILHLRVRDFVINKKGEPDVNIFGKGNKHRCTPLSAEIVPYYKEYCSIFHEKLDEEQDEIMFYTIRNGVKAQMSADNVQRLMKSYEAKARTINKDLPHLHPHLWRRTRAMHLYVAGVPLPLVSEWLGHSNEETTRLCESYR